MAYDDQSSNPAIMIRWTNIPIIGKIGVVALKALSSKSGVLAERVKEEYHEYGITKERDGWRVTDEKKRLGMRLLVIIPAYNEEASLQNTIQELRKKAHEEDFVVVNDGSGDKTAAICRENGYPLLDLPTNLGLTGAFQTGMRYALEQGYDAALQLDADGQHDPAFIRPMAEMMEKENLDLVLGSRFLKKKRPRSLRMAGNALIECALKITTGKKITDPTCGMRLYGRRVMEHMAYAPVARPEPDTLAFLIRSGAKMGECPVSIRERQAGESYLSLSKSFRYMAQMGMNIFILQWVMKKEKL